MNTFWSSPGGEARALLPCVILQTSPFLACLAALLRRPVLAPCAQVCCSESRPAWLLVSLGAVRPLAALQLVQSQDMSHVLSVANASDGPYVQVASQTCDTCLMNVNLARVSRTTFRLAPETAAAYVRLDITWSSAGGVGGCACPRYKYRAVASLC